MRVLRSEDLAELLAPMLRLPAHTLRFNLRAEAGQLAVVECEYVLIDPPFMNGEFRKQLAEYSIVQTSAPKKFDFDVWMAERRELAHQAHMKAAKLLKAIDSHIEIVKNFKKQPSPGWQVTEPIH